MSPLDWLYDILWYFINFDYYDNLELKKRLSVSETPEEDAKE